MKNIFIGGVAKSGKSTLAKKLCKDEKYNHIPVDYFTASFKRNYPDVGIISNVVVNEETSTKLSLFLSTVIGIIDTTDENFIINTITNLEGHPDNVVPAYLGGFVASYKINDLYKYISLTILYNQHHLKFGITLARLAM